MKRLKLLEKDNVRLKKLVAELSLDKAVLQDVVKKWGAFKPARARQLVEYLRTSYRISIRRACGVVRSTAVNEPLKAASHLDGT
jgi:hypothetical protein